MNTEIKKILHLSNFFKTNLASETINVKFLKPSLKLYKNIKSHWLKYTYIKTNHQPFNAASEENKFKIQLKGINGSFIENYNSQIPEEILLRFHDSHCEFINPTRLKLHFLFPKQDIMQYFTRWQRYRKYWWSSITTTPSLLLINDMKHENNMINVNIIANFTFGQHIVESLTVCLNENDSHSRLTCSMGLENALFTIMLDALSNATEYGYLRLHNKMAPYKMSFALNLQDTKHKCTMEELARLIYLQLSNRHISTLLPDFSLSLEAQIKQNLELGITYTVIISDATLKNGFLHLVNSNTMLEEQLHIADLLDYALKLCSGPIIPGALDVQKEKEEFFELV